MTRRWFEYLPETKRERFVRWAQTERGERVLALALGLLVITFMLWRML